MAAEKKQIYRCEVCGNVVEVIGTEEAEQSKNSLEAVCRLIADPGPATTWDLKGRLPIGNKEKLL